MAVFYSYLLTFILMATLQLAKTQEPLAAELPIHHAACPLVDDANHAVQLPNPTNCNKYYSCRLGMAYPMTCPDNLHWSTLTYRCDYAEVANCVSSTAGTIVDPTKISSTNGTPAQAASSASGIALPTAESTLYQAYPSDCSRFYQCEAMRCPPNLHWNARLQRCDYPHLAECAQPTSTTSATTLPSVTSNTNNIPTAATPPPTPAAFPANNSSNPTAAVASDLDALCSNSRQKYITYPGDCHKFIQCNGIAFVHTCPANLFWNSQLLTCDRYCK